MDPVRNHVCPVFLPLVSLVLLPLAPLVACGGMPQVQFDVKGAVPCYDITPSEFAQRNPHERLVEARFEVSALLQTGDEKDLLQYVYQVVSPRQTLPIVDYAPKTTLVSDTAGTIAVEERSERHEQAAANLATVGAWPINGSAASAYENHSLQTGRYEWLPSLLPVAASGTLQRGYGVYFKLKPSRRQTLEGGREFTLLFCVPAEWRGDYVQLTCRATGMLRSVMPAFSATQTCGARRFTIALYAAGDAEAQAAAERLVRAESALLRSVALNRREIEKRLSRPAARREIGGRRTAAPIQLGGTNGVRRRPGAHRPADRSPAAPSPRGRRHVHRRETRPVPLGRRPRT
jgi:hypothetical protein